MSNASNYVSIYTVPVTSASVDLGYKNQYADLAILKAINNSGTMPVAYQIFSKINYSQKNQIKIWLPAGTYAFSLSFNVPQSSDVQIAASLDNPTSTALPLANPINSGLPNDIRSLYNGATLFTYNASDTFAFSLSHTGDVLDAPSKTGRWLYLDVYKGDQIAGLDGGVSVNTDLFRTEYTNLTFTDTGDPSALISTTPDPAAPSVTPTQTVAAAPVRSGTITVDFASTVYHLPIDSGTYSLEELYIWQYVSTVNDIDNHGSNYFTADKVDAFLLACGTTPTPANSAKYVYGNTTYHVDGPITIALINGYLDALSGADISNLDQSAITTATRTSTITFPITAPITNVVFQTTTDPDSFASSNADTRIIKYLNANGSANGTGMTNPVPAVFKGYVYYIPESVWNYLYHYADVFFNWTLTLTGDPAINEAFIISIITQDYFSSKTNSGSTVSYLFNGVSYTIDADWSNEINAWIDALTGIDLMQLIETTMTVLNRRVIFPISGTLNAVRLSASTSDSDTYVTTDAALHSAIVRLLTAQDTQSSKYKKLNKTTVPNANVVMDKKPYSIPFELDVFIQQYLLFYGNSTDTTSSALYDLNTILTSTTVTTLDPTWGTVTYTVKISGTPDTLIPVSQNMVPYLNGILTGLFNADFGTTNASVTATSFTVPSDTLVVPSTTPTNVTTAIVAFIKRNIGTKDDLGIVIKNTRHYILRGAGEYLNNYLLGLYKTYGVTENDVVNKLISGYSPTHLLAVNYQFTFNTKQYFFNADYNNIFNGYIDGLNKLDLSAFTETDYDRNTNSIPKASTYNALTIPNNLYFSYSAAFDLLPTNIPTSITAYLTANAGKRESAAVRMVSVIGIDTNTYLLDEVEYLYLNSYLRFLALKSLGYHTPTVGEIITFLHQNTILKSKNLSDCVQYNFNGKFYRLTLSSVAYINGIIDAYQNKNIATYTYNNTVSLANSILFTVTVINTTPYDMTLTTSILPTSASVAAFNGNLSIGLFNRILGALGSNNSNFGRINFVRNGKTYYMTPFLVSFLTGLEKAILTLGSKDAKLAVYKQYVESLVIFSNKGRLLSYSAGLKQAYLMDMESYCAAFGFYCGVVGLQPFPKAFDAVDSPPTLSNLVNLYPTGISGIGLPVSDVIRYNARGITYNEMFYQLYFRQDYYPVVTKDQGYVYACKDNLYLLDPKTIAFLASYEVMSAAYGIVS